ncbi:WYL domain-containing protein [Ktedonosporobacter rubrisoli]|uniref:WYL domain-containing protein n=1 Tax=Ktedonosporobacter rubrisoli TaxID=2509675 RepID=A0A4P6JN00_KTERU|nr:WYL domain-containing protein [Ktedonosporobacter rubrisoli]QBD76668.1 WYL domain-containing protein [Ktedonosporobacter rubrisoli]
MRADRLVAIVLHLQTRKKMTAMALARELEVSTRTILRDVEALSIAGVPIYATGGRGGGIALDEHYRVTLSGLKEAEAQAFLLSSNLQLLREIGLGDAAENAFLKVAAAVPTHYHEALSFMRQRIYIDPIWWWHDVEPPPFLRDIQQAVYESRWISAVYEHWNGGCVEQLLEPYSLVAKSSAWYLVARREGALRTYRLSRFHAITLLDTHFIRTADFDLPTYWQQHIQEFSAITSVYSFTLRFHESCLPLVRRLLPGRSTIFGPADGDGCMNAHFNVESIDQAKMLVFGLGGQVEVIEPPELQAAVLHTAYDLIYSSSKSGEKRKESSFKDEEHL